jgi:DNA invertase Pin-like site-specific DNA recombinase
MTTIGYARVSTDGQTLVKNPKAPAVKREAEEDGGN